MKYVNVVIPNYNNEKYLEECVTSVLSQDFENINIIFVDDGSTDKSFTKVKNYENEKFHIVCQPNMNASVARNNGMRFLKDGYVLFLDSDDFLAKGCISRMVTEIEKHNADLVIGNYIDFSESTRKVVTNYRTEVYTGDKIRNLIYDSPVPSNKLFKTDIILEKKIWFGNFRIGQDANFYFKYLVNCNKVVTIDDMCYHHRVTANNMSNSINMNFLDVVNAFLSIEKTYEKTVRYDWYKTEIINIAYKNMFWQMMKYRNFENKYDRLIAINYFSYYLKKIEKQYKIIQREKILFNILFLIKPVLHKKNVCRFIERILDSYGKTRYLKKARE